MGKTGKWFKSFLVGKKDKGDSKDQRKNVNTDNTTSIATDHPDATTPVVVVVPRPATPKEKKRWSFRRSSASNNNNNNNNNNNSSTTTNSNKAAAAKDVADGATDTTAVQESQPIVPKDTEAELPQEEVAVVATDETVAVVNEEESAVKIQAVFRSYLARKALKALRGLVKLQALVRGHLVRKQATATLRCMQALVTAQARARAQRIRSGDELLIINQMQSTPRRLSHDRIRTSNYDLEENIKIVEMDHGEYRSNFDSRSSYSIPSQHHIDDRMDSRMSLSPYYSSQGQYVKQDYQQYSPAPSAINDFSPRTCSGHFEDYSIPTAQSSPQCYSAMSRPDPSRALFPFPKPDFAETMSYEYPLYPNYMSNTESSRAKVRSQSAPKQRPELERQPSRGRRPSVEGRNIPKGSKMQRSSSQLGSAAQNYHYPWSVKLDKSNVSLRDSECGSSYSVATNAYYCRSVISYDVSSSAGKGCS